LSSKITKDYSECLFTTLRIVVLLYLAYFHEGDRPRVRGLVNTPARRSEDFHAQVALHARRIEKNYVQNEGPSRSPAA